MSVMAMMKITVMKTMSVKVSAVAAAETGSVDECYDGDEHRGAGARCPQRGLLYQITAGLQTDDSSLSLTLMR